MKCDFCGVKVSNDEICYIYNDKQYCAICYAHRIDHCHQCSTTLDYYEEGFLYATEDRPGVHILVCADCFSRSIGDKRKNVLRNSLEKEDDANKVLKDISNYIQPILNTAEKYCGTAVGTAKVIYSMIKKGIK